MTGRSHGPGGDLGRSCGLAPPGPGFYPQHRKTDACGQVWARVWVSSGMNTPSSCPSPVSDALHSLAGAPAPGCVEWRGLPRRPTPGTPSHLLPVPVVGWRPCRLKALVIWSLVGGLPPLPHLRPCRAAFPLAPSRAAVLGPAPGAPPVSPQGSLTPRDHALSKCFLPREHTVLTLYCAAAGLLAVLALARVERLATPVLSAWMLLRAHAGR